MKWPHISKNAEKHIKYPILNLHVNQLAILALIQESKSTVSRTNFYN